MHFRPSLRLLAQLLSPFVLFLPLHAQFEWEIPKHPNHQIETPLSGQLECPGVSDYSRLRVQIWDAGGRQPIVEGQVNAFGGFEIQNVPSGSFQLHVVNMQGDTIHSVGVSLPYNGSFRVAFGLGASAQARVPISLTRLQHKVPKKAMKAYREARAAMQKEERKAAMTALEAAIRIDPQFFEAANDLGVMYLTDSRLSEAYEMFHRATTIDEGDATAEANLAYVLLALHRFPEAEQAARSSVRADALSSRGRFLLAVSLLEQRKSRKEVLFHLLQAKEHFEPARKLLKKLEMQMGQ